jgi:hypothetical protein
MKFLITIILLNICNYLYSQSITRKIVDSKTGSRLPYATIKILHAPKGTIATERGEFNLEINSADSVLFSYIGYQQRILTGNNIGDTIYLVRKIKTLQEITVKEKKLLRTLLVGNKDGNLIGDMNWGPSNDGKDEFAQKIGLPDSSLFYKIKKIYIPVQKHVCYGPILLHIYASDSNSEFPSEELLLKRIDIDKRNIKNSNLSIDISNENLYLNNLNFFFISIGWPDVAFNGKCITTILLSRLSKEKTYSRTLYSSSYNWFHFGSMKDINGNLYEVATFYSVEVDEMK